MTHCTKGAPDLRQMIVLRWCRVQDELLALTALVSQAHDAGALPDGEYLSAVEALGAAVEELTCENRPRLS